MAPGIIRRELSEADFVRLHPKLISLFRRLGMSLEGARDLAQETFLQVCQSLESFESRSDLDTWVYSIGKRVWLKSLRSRAAQKREATEVAIGEEEGPAAGAAATFEEQLLGQDLLDRVKTSIRTLPASMRDSLVMYADGTKYREIASRLGITESRVASLIYQARAKLRRELS